MFAHQIERFQAFKRPTTIYEILVFNLLKLSSLKERIMDEI